MSWVALLWKYHKNDGSFLFDWAKYSQRRRGDLFISSFFAVTFFWLVDVFLVAVVFVVVVFLAILLLCSRPVSSKDFVINLQLIWRKILCSNPGRIVTIRITVLLTNSEARISIVSCIVCNVDIKATKSWKRVIVAVRGVSIEAVYVRFEISITVVVFQRVYEGICRILIFSRPWRDKKTKDKQLEIHCSSVEFNRPFYSYGWKRGWIGSCFDITIRFLLLYLNPVFLC